ncbi:SRPBCC family protein [Terriglobus sp.]|uniref:SRPBCC family protein n=1 Tax=Terriglobus sp. TaxID=1889013 RepID=UPI003AFFD9D1
MLFHLRDRQLIPAPLSRVFALSTSVPAVARTLGFTPVQGVTTGHVELHSRVLWRGWLFGLPQHHLTLITDYAAPHTDDRGNQVAWFQDSQERGRFAFFQHNHHMLAAGPSATLLQDEIRFALPFGLAGALVARFLMLPYIAKTLRSRMNLLTRLATTPEGDQYL